jgi:hypothetical protein
MFLLTSSYLFSNFLIVFNQLSRCKCKWIFWIGSFFLKFFFRMLVINWLPAGNWETQVRRSQLKIENWKLKMRRKRRCLCVRKHHNNFRGVRHCEYPFRTATKKYKDACINPNNNFRGIRHWLRRTCVCERSEAIHKKMSILDCFAALAMTLL